LGEHRQFVGEKFCDLKTLGGDRFGYYTRRLSNADVAAMLTRRQREKLLKIYKGGVLAGNEQRYQLWMMDLIDMGGTRLTERGRTIARFYL